MLLTTLVELGRRPRAARSASGGKAMSIHVYNMARLSPGELGPTAVAIGNFDGVHLAHRVLCRSLIDKARELDALPVIYTFQPHPRKVLQGPHAVKELTSFEKKCELLGELGVEILVWSEFTREFSEQTPADFISHMLVHKLGIQHIFVGYDSHFAHNREGNFNVLAEMGARLGFGIDRTEAVMEEGLIVSSSQIRQFLETGDVRRANKFLGWRYEIGGTVVRGDQRGRRIGFPTANLESDAEVIPAEGVYATFTRVTDRLYPSVTNVGRNPTFHHDPDIAPLRVETHLFDFSETLYGTKLDVVFIERIRREKRFEGLDALKAQIEQDARVAREILSHEENL